MAGISSKAVFKALSPFKANGGSEFEDEGGLDYYNTFFRKYDAQIGRFTGIDSKAESFMGLTPFQFGNNNPAMYNDPRGDKYVMIKPAEPMLNTFAMALDYRSSSGGADYHNGMKITSSWDDMMAVIAANGGSSLGGGGGGGNLNGNVGVDKDGNIVTADGDFAKLLFATLQTAFGNPNNDCLTSYNVFSNDHTLLGSMCILKNESFIGPVYGVEVGGASVSLGYTSYTKQKKLDWIQLVKSNVATPGHPANQFFIDGSNMEGHKSFPYQNTKEDMMEWLHDPDSKEFRNTNFTTWFHDAPFRRYSDGAASWEAYVSLVDKSQNNAILFQFHYGYTNSVANGNQTSYQPLQVQSNPMPLPWFLTTQIIFP